MDGMTEICSHCGHWMVIRGTIAAATVTGHRTEHEPTVKAPIECVARAAVVMSVRPMVDGGDHGCDLSQPV